jgi:hypothetical protein
MYLHRYDTLTCPDCQSDLTRPGTLNVTFANWDVTIAENSAHLLADGTLEMDDRRGDALISAGLHSGTFCDHCGAQLHD